MPWRDERFVDLKNVLNDKVKVRPSFRAAITAGLETAEAYNELHAAGFCYADISAGNVSFDLETGEARICDNDNVDVNGEKMAVAGTPGYMAPEIVHDFTVAQKAQPNADTDRWSLAVLLYKLLVRDHPLEGAREDQPLPPSDYDLYGPDAVFIWDESDESNRPVPGLHNNALRFWPALPRFIQKLFTQTFTVGIRNPSRRVFEAAWIKTMSRLRDSISPCPSCGAENFYDAEANMQARCWSCGKPRTRPLILDLPGSKCAVVAGAEATLFPHHVRPQAGFDFSRVVASIVSVSQGGDAVGIKNLGDEPWRITFENSQRVAPPRSVVVLHPGLHINFGSVEGVVS
jgi:DNA-binding helix-hairpin-helix protein with protein kinase domain